MADQTEIRGLAETQAKIAQVVADLRGPAFRDGMRQATALVTADARRFAPVDTGRLRSSIMPELRQSGRTTLGVVGSNVLHAAPVELGSKAHAAPAGPLKLWARRKGKTAFLAAIGNKPYIWLRAKKGVFYLRRALAKNETRIQTLIGHVVKDIVTK